MTSNEQGWFYNHDVLNRYGKLESLCKLLCAEGCKNAKVHIDDFYQGCNYDDIEKKKNKHNRDTTVDIVTIDANYKMLLIECKFEATTGGSINSKHVKEKFKYTVCDLNSSCYSCGISKRKLIILPKKHFKQIKSSIARHFTNSPDWKIITIEELPNYL